MDIAQVAVQVSVSRKRQIGHFASAPPNSRSRKNRWLRVNVKRMDEDNEWRYCEEKRQTTNQESVTRVGPLLLS